jgi:hypothetical protein
MIPLEKNGLNASHHTAMAQAIPITTRRFRLNAAYCEPLVASHVAIDFMQVEPEARRPQ